MANEVSKRVKDLVKELQNKICNEITKITNTEFRNNSWKREHGGGGETRILHNNEIIEKAGVNTSCVYGNIQDRERTIFQKLLNQQNKKIKNWNNASFYATGVSLVIHPQNPFVPTTHANFRYFELNTDEDKVWWFGGGADLTPYYIFEEDCKHFHNILKKGCDATDSKYYEQFKKKCDEYFYIPHRKEHRGIGGIFYDYLNDKDTNTLINFTKNIGESFIDAYIPILKKRYQKNFNKKHKEWQLNRRGRYVEFNLIYDRGTHFGLATNGRIESILMSLPKNVMWEYDYQPKPNTEEEKTVALLKNPIDWI